MKIFNVYVHEKEMLNFKPFALGEFGKCKGIGCEGISSAVVGTIEESRVFKA